jgi:hypothetical protein
MVLRKRGPFWRPLECLRQYSVLLFDQIRARNSAILADEPIDTQADSLESQPVALAAFDEWARRFAQHVQGKGILERADDAARSAKSTTQ